MNEKEKRTPAEEARAALPCTTPWGCGSLGEDKHHPTCPAYYRPALMPVFERAQPCRESHAVRDYPDLRRRAEEADALRERAERAETMLNDERTKVEAVRIERDKARRERDVARQALAGTAQSTFKSDKSPCWCRSGPMFNAQEEEAQCTARRQAMGITEPPR